MLTSFFVSFFKFFTVLSQLGLPDLAQNIKFCETYLQIVRVISAQFASQLQSVFSEKHISPFKPKKDNLGRKSFSPEENFDIPEQFPMLMGSLYVLTRNNDRITDMVNAWLQGLVAEGTLETFEPFPKNTVMIFGVQEDMVQTVSTHICNTFVNKLSECLHNMQDSREAKGLGRFLLPGAQESAGNNSQSNDSVVADDAPSSQRLLGYLESNLSKLLANMKHTSDSVPEQLRLLAIVKCQSKTKEEKQKKSRQMNSKKKMFQFQQGLKLGWKRTIGDMKTAFFLSIQKPFSEKQLTFFCDIIKGVIVLFQRLSSENGVVLPELLWGDHVVEWNMLATEALISLVCYSWLSALCHSFSYFKNMAELWQAGQGRQRCCALPDQHACPQGQNCRRVRQGIGGVFAEAEQMDQASGGCGDLGAS